jgi:hypothetical protein
MVDWRTDDRELLARILTAEAGNQGPVGMLAAGNVVMNRVSLPGYGNGVRDVIMKPGQFSPMNSVTGYARGEQGQNIDAIRPDETAYMVADSLLSGTAGDITGGATHFYNPDISNPSWAEGKDFTRIGDHVFGRADADRGTTQNTRATAMIQPTMMPSQPTQEQQPGGIRGLLSNPDFLDSLAIGFGGLTQNPNQALMQMSADRIAGRAQTRQDTQSKNKTIEFLRAQPGGERFVQLVDAIGAVAALKAYQDSQQAAEPNRGVVVGDRLVDPVTGQVIADFAGEQGGMTTAVETLHQRALAGGLEPGSDEYRKFMVAGGADSGMSLQVGPDGTVSFGTGSQAGKPLTEGQSKDTVYATRAEGALTVLNEYDVALANLGDKALNVDPTGLLRGPMQSTDFQLAQQAGDEFLQAILRKDTGASITASEQALYGVTYLPQLGDSPEVIAQKRQSRQRALEAIKAGLPPSAIVAQERALQRSGSSDTAQDPPVVGNDTSQMSGDDLIQFYLEGN